MSGPATRPPAWREPIDYVGMAEADNGSSVSQSNTWNINSPLPWLVLLAILSGVALGLSVGARDVANKAEREARLQRLEIDELKVALRVQGIKIHEGSKP